MINKKEEELRKEGAEEMLNRIYRSGQKAFDGLLKSLADAGYEELSSKLDLDLEQKKKERANVGLEIDLIEFPYYYNRWPDSRSWCIIMNNWFKNHDFKTEEELKMVVKYWLWKLEEVVDR
ncbi:hypothetical protein LOTGIDRAFT_176580, partial [Lottia gigantea]